MSLVLPPLDGRLDLKGLLGEGGMGQVFRAWDRTLERSVAVKFVRGTDPREAERLLLEARLQARVEHPAVVRVHDTGTLDGRPCIIMQLVEGSSLEALSPSLDLATKVEILRQAAEGIHAAHRQGLVHRDVKPGNILVEDTPEGLRARVTDFGLARDLDASRSRSGLPAGTLDFMSPEQLLASGPVEFRTDVYGLGATLFAVLTGCLPFRTTAARRPEGTLPTPELPAEEDIHLLRRILDEDPPPLRSLLPGLPRDLDVVVHMAMQKDPTGRYATAEAFAQDLGRFQRGEPILARTPGLLDQAAKWTRRNRTAARALGVAALAILLGLGFAAWTSRRANRQSLEAARFGALAESLEARLRQENLAPAHDLTPILDQVKSAADRLQGAALKGGPAAFARGRAQELLGDWDAAREAFQRAWETGYRDPGVADALGLTLIRIYDRELRTARATLAPSGFQARQTKLDHDLRDPALSLLAQGDRSGWRGPWARIALASLQRDFEGSRRQARALQRQDPQHYEAWTLEGEIWLDEAALRLDENRTAEATTALDAAEQALQRALAWGRSDNRPLAGFARLHTLRGTLLVAAGREPVAETRAAMGWLEQALAIRPSHPALLHAKAAALIQQARSPLTEGQDARIAKTTAAIALLDQAAARSPRTVNHLLLLAEAWTLLAQLSTDGASSKAAVDQGLVRIHQAETLAPEDPRVPAIAASLQFMLANALKVAGQDPEAALRSGLAAAQRALDLDTTNSLRIRLWMLPLQVELGRVAWRKGQDPQPDLLKAAAGAETVLRENPGLISVYVNAVYVLQTAADQLADFDGDAEGLLARANAALDRGDQLRPAYEPLLQNRGFVQLIEAYWRCLHDQDPGPALAAARLAFSQSVRNVPKGQVSVELLASAALVEARWAQQQGRSPELALAQVEQPGLKALAQVSPGVNQNLAQAALVRGLWLRAQDRPSLAEAQRGLALLALALQADPGDPSLRVVQARLHALAGDGPAARESLAEARKLNPLIAHGADFQRATREAA